MDWNITKKEVIWIIITIIIFGFITGISYKEDTLVIDYNLSSLIVPILVILTSVIAKKIIGNVHCIKIEHSVWKFRNDPNKSRRIIVFSAQNKRTRYFLGNSILFPIVF